MPHTDQKWRHDLALYLSLLQSYTYRDRFILNPGEHEVLRFIQLNIYKKTSKSHVVDVFSATIT